jgi:hypothetical protein|tara:strand:+ start:6846 stop:7073 length:228 start_codon:yes stop_codon:yes gene_type:complete
MDYVSGIGGPWDKGDKIELDDANAQALERDCPGLLVKLRTQPKKQDRQLRRKTTRQERGGQSPITREDFKAVKNG